MNRRFSILLAFILFFTSCDSSDTLISQEESGVDSTMIEIGSSSALTGHAGFLGSQYLHGAMAYINEINANGGVNGRQIQIIALDDQYDPIKTIANTQKLIYEEDVFALFNYVGTPTSVAVKPIVETSKIPIFGFFTGAEALRTPPNNYIFHLRDSYYAEAEGAVSYFVDHLGLQKIGVLYQEDAFGTAVLIGIQQALQRRGLQTVVTDTIARGSMDLQNSVQRINNENVDVIMMVGTYSPLAKFVKETHDSGYTPLFSTVSFIGSEAYAKELIEEQNISKKYFKDIIVTQVVPAPNSKNNDITTEYLTLIQKYYPEETPNYVAFEGFLNAKILVMGLEQAGRELTRPGFIAALKQIKNYDLGIGKKISYGQSDHEGIQGIYLSHLISNNRFEIFNP